MAHKDKQHRSDDVTEHHQPTATQHSAPATASAPKAGEQKIEVSNPNGDKLVLTATYTGADPDAKIPDKVRGFLNTLDSLANAALR